jgi:hypothetical protein
MKKITMIILISPLVLMMACKEKSPDSCGGDPVYQSLGWNIINNTGPWNDLTFTTFRGRNSGLWERLSGPRRTCPDIMSHFQTSARGKLNLGSFQIPLRGYDG